jgi:exo-beta-1,3-glucanase (GH17 family)/cellulose synthase/poly-beta-1,6-N-acetylglucosamine synthase-like glycosyltransferase
VIAVALVAATWSLWAFFNQPRPEPPWPKTIQGFAFSPFRMDQDAVARRYPSLAEIDQDLALLAGRAHAVRTYTVEGPLGEIPRLAAAHDLNVALGAWVDRREAESEAQVEQAIRLAWKNTNVVRLIVGNETLLRGDVEFERLAALLDRARAAVHQPVSTAETWDVWLKNPELAEHVDFIAAHVLPYWEGIDAELAVEYVNQRVALLKTAFPDKPVVLAEVGWPSNGRTRKAAVASTANEALFLRRFLDEAERRDYIYYLMEAFDQPWKEQNEGAVGAYWGVWNVEREPKFPFDAPLVSIPHWPLLAMSSIVIASIVLAVLLLDSRTLSRRGRGFLALVAFGAATMAVWVVNDYFDQYLDFQRIAVGIALIVGMLGVTLVVLTEAHEWVEARWASRRREFTGADSGEGDQDLPFVSIHVPAYNEPADMMIETLDALAALDYPHFEVIVIDNNTPDPATWAPVEAHCARLGSRFRFFHQKPLAGFKAGALNFALRQTDERAAVVAVIDSDYQVDADWLEKLMPLFVRSGMDIVQAPQDYRDGGESLFKAMCHAEYRGFFRIGMVTRNERNAIIQHGTMTAIRRDLLERLDGWAEWTVTEDAELGLRAFAAGAQAAYVPESFGRGLMPDTFTDYRLQRFRWAFGAMQILRRHGSTLLGLIPSRLSLGQRYHFFAGWLPWIADGFNLVFNLAAIVWAVLMIVFPARFDAPLLAFTLLPMSLFAFKVAKLIHLYLTRVGGGWRHAIGASLAGLALTHTIGLAVLRGLSGRPLAFYRTPKQAGQGTVARAFVEAREETLLMLALWLAAGAVAARVSLESPDVMVWISVLLLQSIPPASSLLLALIAGLGLPARWIGAVNSAPRGQQALSSRPG